MFAASGAMGNLVVVLFTIGIVAASFSSADSALRIICGAVNEILSMTVDAFSRDDKQLVRKIEPFEEVIDDMVMILRDRHTKRLKARACSVNSGLVFMETLTYLERASDQCSSIAVMMMSRDNETILQNHYEYLRDMAYARKDADTLEALVGKSRWPYPTYSDLLFY